MKFMAFGEDVDSIIIGLENAIEGLKEGYTENYDYQWILEEDEDDNKQ